MAVPTSKNIPSQFLLSPRPGGFQSISGQQMGYFNKIFPYAQFANYPPHVLGMHQKPQIKESVFPEEFGGELNIPHVKETQVDALDYLKESYVGDRVSRLKFNTESGKVTPIDKSVNNDGYDSSKKPDERWADAVYRRVTGTKPPMRPKQPSDDPKHDVVVEIVPMDLAVQKLHKNKVAGELGGLKSEGLVQKRLAELKTTPSPASPSPASSLQGSPDSRSRTNSFLSSGGSGDVKSNSSKNSEWEESIKELLDKLSDSKDPVKNISRSFKQRVSQVKNSLLGM